MAASTPISGQGTTFNLPNYTGVLYQLSPSDVPFFSAIGGLNGGREIHSTQWEWQGFDLRDSAATNQALEGADAPAGVGRVRENFSNLVEVHQSAVEVSYSRAAAYGLLASDSVGAEGASNPVHNELDWQITQELKAMLRDIELSFLSGTYNSPADNTAKRRTRGLLEAIVANVVAVTPEPGTGGDGTGGMLSEEILGNALQKAYDGGGLVDAGAATLVVNSALKRVITKLYKKDGTFRDNSRNVGGVNVTTVETDFGILNIMLDRNMPADVLLIASLDQIAPVYLNVPGKGHFFAEPLAKTGAADKVQIYGEVGLEYGDQRAHAKITGLNAALSAYDA